MSWVARNYTLDRDGLRLAVSLEDSGFKETAWCWFVYKRDSFWWKTLARGRAGTLEESQAAANEWADRHMGKVCLRCGLTKTEIAGDACNGSVLHPYGDEHSLLHVFEQRTP